MVNGHGVNTNILGTPEFIFLQNLYNLFTVFLPGYTVYIRCTSGVRVECIKLLRVSGFALPNRLCNQSFHACTSNMAMCQRKDTWVLGRRRSAAINQARQNQMVDHGWSLLLSIRSRPRTPTM